MPGENTEGSASVPAAAGFSGSRPTFTRFDAGQVVAAKGLIVDNGQTKWKIVIIGEKLEISYSSDAGKNYLLKMRVSP